jgi:hypothetical protein
MSALSKKNTIQAIYIKFSNSLGIKLLRYFMLIQNFHVFHTYRISNSDENFHQKYL